MTCCLPGCSPLGLPPLPHPQPDRRQVAGDFGRGTRDGIHQPIAQRIVAFVVFCGDGVGRAEVIGGQKLAVADDRLIVDQVIERELVHVLRRFSDRGIDVERHLVGQPVHVQQIALDIRIDRPERHAASYAQGAKRSAEIVAVEHLSPMGHFAQRVRHQLGAAEVEGQIELLPRHFAIARRTEAGDGGSGMWFPGQVTERGQIGCVGGCLLDRQSGHSRRLCARTR